MRFDRPNTSGSDLEKYFNSNDKRLIHKWSHYFDIYERHFSRFRNKPIVILEIGVFQGGSLQMWKDYFGSQVEIHGVDINPNCKSLEEENIHIHIGSQTDRAFLQKLKAQIPMIDILIDDGGHTMKQQRITFEEMYTHVKEEGVYVCEDLHTSYWLEYGGGVRRRKTFIEFSKRLIDQLNAYHSRQAGFKPDSFTRTTDSMHFYDSVLVIEKRQRPKPMDLKSGVESYSHNYHSNKGSVLKHKILTLINKILRFFRLPGFIWK